MAKVKNKRNAGAADKVHKKKKVEANKKKVNPFEVHINREKIKVLGKKSKHDRGLPGVSRAKAIQKRKETLGTEMKLMHKTNTFIDRRIGEKDNELTAEDRMVARFAAERAKQHTRKNIYNLADDEVLTHRGQTLEQIEKFDDPRSDEEDEAGFKGLDDDFVSEGHFGGGMLSKSDAKDGAKSHKDLIEQLIAESKKRKAEKQKEKEQTLDLTEKLDSEWKDLQPVVFKRAREQSAIEKVLEKAEKNSLDYDKTMRELRFEKRGTPSDGLKSNEKQEKEEQLRLAQLEKELIQRMQPDYQEPKNQPAKKHRSADDLDDNFELDDKQDFMLAYDKDGKPLVPENILKDYSVPNAKKKFDGGLTDSSEEEEEGDDEEEDSESEDESEEEPQTKKKKESDKTMVIQNGSLVKEKSILFNSDQSDDDTNEESDTENKTGDSKIANTVPEDLESDDNSSDDNDDIQEQVKSNKIKIDSKTASAKESETDESSDDDDDDINDKVQNSTDNAPKANNSCDNYENIKKNAESKSNKIKIDKNVSSEESESDEESSDDEKPQNVKKSSKIDEKSDESKSEEEISDIEFSNKIGSFFDKSTDYENLKELLSGKTPSQQSTAIQKLIKSYDPSLGENNKNLLTKLFANLLQYVNDLFSNSKDEAEIMKSFLIIDKIAPYFYDLAHTNKVSSRKLMAELLKEKYDLYKKKPRKVPDMDTLIFFKIISLLYPTSDFRHPITTPSMIFMSEILTTSKFRDAYSISRGLFLTALILEYTALSKRFVPSTINFIRGILYMSANISLLTPIKVVPPFRLHKDAKILNLEEDCSKIDVGWRMTRKDLVSNAIDNEFKIRTVLNATLMLKEFFDNCNEMEAQECIFEPHIQLLSRLDLDLYPKRIRNTIEEVMKHMKGTLEVKTYTPLCREKPKIKMLRMYEPEIQQVFTGSKSSNLSREKAESKRLQHKYKKEMKGALREIRRDKSYIASVKIREKIHSDNVRKERVKQIYKDASIQQGELNKLKRSK